MTIQLQLEGARCASCVSKIETALMALSGVSAVQVNLADQSVEVTGNASEADLIAALEAVGYPARPLATNQDTCPFRACAVPVVSARSKTPSVRCPACHRCRSTWPTKPC